MQDKGDTMQISYQKYDKKRVEYEVRESEKLTGHPLNLEEKRCFDRKAELLTEKPQQIARAFPDEMVGVECVQAYVSNMSTATTLEELEYTDGITLPENLMSAVDKLWTAPKWAKAGDVVFFMHSKTARSTITRLRSELFRNRDKMSAYDYDRLMNYIGHCLDIYSQYGGKIFAIGRVCGGPKYVEPENVMESVLHWRSRNYSAIDNIHILEKPLDISEFKYIHITRGGATTPLYDYEFDHLREDIGKNNDLPQYVKNSTAKPIPLRKINAQNWIEIANDYRRCFILEKQFRQFYVDYLLRDIGDKKKFFTECRCQRNDIHDSFMDYVIRFEGKLLPVEVKLSVNAEPNIVGQVSKYVFNNNVFLTDDGSRCASGKEFHDGKVLIIDTEKLYWYEAESNKVNAIFDLDDLTDREILQNVRQVICDLLTGS